jgi:hypothetical protein
VAMNRVECDRAATWCHVGALGAHGAHECALCRYIPRILFLNKDAKVVDSIKNPNGNPKYGYYYSDADQVAEGMKAAIESLGGATEEL